MQGISVTLEELLALRYMANKMHLPPHNNTSSIQHGNYHSPFRGRGMDFVENRIYQPGDDIRTINWAVTARIGKAHTKIYQQERERPIYLILDFNHSMFFGTRVAFKSVIAAKAAALIAWVALKQGDRIGASLITANKHILLPCHNKRNIVDLLKNIASCTLSNQEGSVDIASAVSKLKRTIKSGSLIYILSDFYCLNNVVENEISQLAKNHEVANILIYDQLEKNSPKGCFLFHDNFQLQSTRVDTYSHSFTSAYKAIFQERFLKVKKLSYKSNMRLIELATDGDLLKTIRQVLKGSAL